MGYYQMEVEGEDRGKTAFTVGSYWASLNLTDYYLV